MLMVASESRDVFRNLAVEEWLLENAPQMPVLFLCVNSPCVVIGKNQNPWRECRLSLMEREGVPLARRISGGGAVYHDEGNLNIGVLVPRLQYEEEKQYELVFRALDAFGIRAGRLGKNSLAVEGLKFSGQAFCYRRDRVLHHGTLLVRSDLQRLGRYLGPELDGIDTRAVASVPARVANLSSFSPGLTVDRLADALKASFGALYGGGGAVDSGSDRLVPDGELSSLVDRLSSGEWKWCHTPRFQVSLNGYSLDVEKGRIANLDGTPRFEHFLAAKKESVRLPEVG